MIIIQNTLDIQPIWIPRNDADGNTHHSQSYEEGYADGMRDQKGKVESINITENGTYTNPNGYSPIVVDVPQGEGRYEEGVEDGKAQQKAEDDAKLTNKTIVQNGDYAAPYGFKNVTVNVPDRYEEGKDAQKAEDDAKLTEKNITLNGTYDAPYGFKKVVVNVPQSGDRYEEGKRDGKNEQEAIDLAKLTTKAINSNGTYDAPYGFKQVTVNVPQGGNYQEKSVKLDNDAQIDVFPDDGYDALSKVHVDAEDIYRAGLGDGVSIAAWDAENFSKTLTATTNGTYEATIDGVKGYYKKVIVNVPDRYQEGFNAGLSYAIDYNNKPNGTYLKVFYTIPSNGTYTIIGDLYPSTYKMSVDGGAWESVKSTKYLTKGDHLIRFEVGTGIGERFFGTTSYFGGIDGHTIVIPNSVTSLNLKAFLNSAENIKTLVFGSGLQSINFDCVTYRTPNIDRIEFYGNVPDGFPAVCEGDRWICADKGMIVVPFGKKALFENAVVGSNFEDWTIYERVD